MTNRLTGCWIRVDVDGLGGRKVFSMDRGSHADLRGQASVEYCLDSGFVDSAGNLLSRREALDVALQAGQVPPQYRDLRRQLLSSDINW